MNLACLLLALASYGLAPVTGYQDEGKPIVQHSFDEDLGAWVANGPTGKAVVFVDPTQGSGGVMRFNYEIAKGAFNVLILPTPKDSLRGAKSVFFQVKSDQATLVAVSLQEEEGGRYTALAYVPQNAWQKVEFSIYDFALATEADDPKDPNGKLDLGEVSAVTIIDLSQFFAQVDSPELASMIDIKTGKHSLYLDNFAITKVDVKPSIVSDNGTVRLDTFTHPQLSWFGLGGGIKLSKEAGAPLTSPGLKAEYLSSPGKLVILTRPIQPWVLTGKRALSLRAASERPTQVVLQLEENGGGKYNTILDIPGARTAKEFSVAFTAFTPSDDSKDTNGTLDLGQVKTISLIDVTGIASSAGGMNTLWLGDIVAKPD